MFASILGPTCGVFLPPASVTHNQCAPSAFGCQAPHLDSMSLSGMRDNGTSPKISAFEGRTRNFVIPNVICRAGSSFAAASRGLILGFACFETYSLCFNVSSGLFFVCADSPPVLFTPSDLLGPLPGRHRSQPFPGAEKIPHPFVPA